MTKIFKSFVNDKIRKYLKALDSSDLQYGLRAFRSTAELLMVLSKCIHNSLDVGSETRAIALDILKAFGKVWHAGQSSTPHDINAGVLQGSVLGHFVFGVYQ